MLEPPSMYTRISAETFPARDLWQLDVFLGGQICREGCTGSLPSTESLEADDGPFARSEWLADCRRGNLAPNPWGSEAPHLLRDMFVISSNVC